MNDNPPCVWRILELLHNGDPYGSGFTAIEWCPSIVGRNDSAWGWFYRGDIGAKPRSWWRNYARKNGYILREYR